MTKLEPEIFLNMRADSSGMRRSWALPVDFSGDFPQIATEKIASIEILACEGASVEFHRLPSGQVAVGIGSWSGDGNGETWAIMESADVLDFSKSFALETEGKTE